eukprot:c27793_g1_i6 orf=408-1631(-)
MSAKTTEPSRLILLFIATLVAGAAVISVDPFRLSVIANDSNFQAQYVQQPSRFQMFSRDQDSKLQVSQKRFLNDGSGPESLVFDPKGRGPYTGVADGRIVRWDGLENGWSEFATTSPNRSEICSSTKPYSKVIETEHICGRPLGLRFDPTTSELYIADAYFGVLKVGPEGGQAAPITTQAEGIPLTFTNDLDISADGTIYFTDSSAKYQRRNFFLLVLSGDDSGRVLKYDPVTKDTKVLIRGLQFPNGVALSKDESFLVIAESVPGRLLRHWLKGPKAGSTELMAILPGHPDNVRRNDKGEFWIALHCRRSLPSRISGTFPALRRWFLKLPIPFKQVYRLFNGGYPHGMVVRYSEQGQLLQVLEDEEGKVVKFASQVSEEDDGQLWIGSVLLPYIAVYDLTALQNNI